jgi:hypothetical protein
MQSNLAAKFLPIISDEKKIEVSLEDDKALIKLSTWVEDLGWCGQKTLAVEAEMLDELHRAISAARYRLSQRKADSGEIIEKKNVIAFPVAA